MVSSLSPQTDKLRQILYLEIIGFSLVILFLLGNEIFDIPHIVFGSPKTPTNWTECASEAFIVFVLALFTSLSTYSLIKKIRLLEGLVPICSNCRQFRVNDQWVSPEKYLSIKTDAMLTHGMCPSCLRKLYPDVAEAVLNHQSLPEVQS